MNDSINYSGFVDMFVDSYDDYESYGYSLSDTDAETAKSSVQLYTADINDSDYEVSNLYAT